MSRIDALILRAAVVCFVATCTHALAATNATEAKPRAFRIERDMDDKKEELRTKKSAISALKSASDVLARASAAAAQATYASERDISSLRSEAEKISTREEFNNFSRKIAGNFENFYRAVPRLDTLINLDESDLTIDEKKILRPMLDPLVAQLESGRSLRRIPRGLPIELLIDEDFIGLKKAFPNYPKDFRPNQPGLQEILASISPERFAEEKKKVLDAISLMQRSLGTSQSELQKSIDSTVGEIDKLAEALDKAREQGSRVDEALIYYALPGLAILMIGLLLAPRVYANDALHLEVFKSGLLLELFTVFFITATILILGLGGRVDAPILGTLLGGISGYVLGRATGKQRGESKSDG